MFVKETIIGISILNILCRALVMDLSVHKYDATFPVASPVLVGTPPCYA